jgi:hypothetical protein
MTLMTSPSTMYAPKFLEDQILPQILYQVVDRVIRQKEVKTGSRG